MIGRIEASLRRWRRRFSRSEWLARLLKLPLSTGTATTPGLVMIQIDGLAQGELEKAMQRGEMPFLRRLINHEHYQLHPLYSGVPSTTPSVQGELFYGVKTGVPSFNFMQRDSKQLVRMFEPAAAADVEQRLERQGGVRLLEGGSCYADNFTGGAAEPHFCPSSLGWGSTLRSAHPLVLFFLIVSNAYSFVRTGALIVLETLLAILDFVRGSVNGRDTWAELKFIPTRVLIVILLRELITIGVKIDIARGLAIIHANFLGYDEQAHRRGPSSLFAHWTLKGIDDAIARIWHAAQHSNRRSYDVWIYSDHGQQQVIPYEKKYGRPFAEAAREVFSRYLGKPVTYQSSGRTGIQLQRIQMLGGERTQRFFAKLLANINNRKYSALEKSNTTQLTVAPLGPVAHLYYHQPLSAQALSDLAQALVEQANVPLVLHRNAAGLVRATTQAGEFSLAQDLAAVLGSENPYPNTTGEDLVAVCEHLDAGVLIACGYSPGSQPLSFAIENGAHGGSSLSETNAFALVPADIALGTPETGEARPAVCPMDLRHAALKFLERDTDNIDSTTLAQQPVYSKTTLRKQAGDTIRLMTYNVHSCIGMDGKLAPERIARIIARYAPDIVALQELDVGRLRTGGVDQAHCIAHYLEMEFHFHSALHLEEERYGNAILTHLPMRLVKSALLPELADKPQHEPRGALWVAIDAGGTEIQLINTHLSVRGKERNRQVQALLSSDWLGHPDCRSPAILCGDFNATPGSNEWRQFHKRMPDAQITLTNHSPKNTFFSRLPKVRIDHVFVDNNIEPVSIETPNTELVRLASDHLPLIVELRNF